MSDSAVRASGASGGGSGGRGQGAQDLGHGGGDFVVICGVSGGESLGCQRHGQGNVVDYVRPGDAGSFAGVLMGPRPAVVATGGTHHSDWLVRDYPALVGT